MHSQLQTSIGKIHLHQELLTNSTYYVDMFLFDPISDI